MPLIAHLCFYSPVRAFLSFKRDGSAVFHDERFVKGVTDKTLDLVDGILRVRDRLTPCEESH